MSEKRKVIFLIESLGSGGAEKVLVTLTKLIDKSKFDVTICTVTDFGVHKSSIPNGVKYLTLLKNPDKNRIKSFIYKVKHRLIHRTFTPRMAYRLFFPKGYDVEVAFCEGFATKLLSGSTSKRSKKIAWVHIDMKNYPQTQRAGLYKDVHHEKLVYACYDQIVAVSDVAHTNFNEIYGLSDRTITAYNPNDVAEIRAKSQEQVEDLPPKLPGRIRMISVGRFVEQKAFDRLIRIADRLIKSGVDAELIILGEGPLKSSIARLATDLGLGDRVILPGFCRNPYKYLATADIFVCSSIAEGFSTAVTEALILGLPVVTTDCSGMRELLGDNKYGIITPNDEEALYQSINDILSTPTNFSHFINKEKICFDDFSLKSNMRQIEEILL